MTWAFGLLMFGVLTFTLYRISIIVDRHTDEVKELNERIEFLEERMAHKEDRPRMQVLS